MLNNFTQCSILAQFVIISIQSSYCFIMICFKMKTLFWIFLFFRKVYKIEVKSQNKSWFVFRRYTDFTRLNERVSGGVNPLYPKISIHILHTPLYVFPLKLTWRICLTIKASQDGNNFL